MAPARCVRSLQTCLRTLAELPVLSRVPAAPGSSCRLKHRQEQGAKLLQTVPGEPVQAGTCKENGRRRHPVRRSINLAGTSALARCKRREQFLKARQKPGLRSPSAAKRPRLPRQRSEEARPKRTYSLRSTTAKVPAPHSTQMPLSMPPPFQPRY
jgi:hypothetical protein